MKTRLLVLAGLMIFTVSALAGDPAGFPGMVAIPKSLQERGHAPKEGSNQQTKSTLPAQVQWNLKALAASFTIVSTTYDTKNWQVSWVLEARRTVTNPEYHAIFRDADLVQWAKVPLTFSPARKEYEPGTRVQAILPLPVPEALQEVTTVTVYSSK